MSARGTQIFCESELRPNPLKLSHTLVDRAGAVRCVFVRQASRCLLIRSQERGIFQCIPFSRERRAAPYIWRWATVRAQLILAPSFYDRCLSLFMSVRPLLCSSFIRSMTRADFYKIHDPC